MSKERSVYPQFCPWCERGRLKLVSMEIDRQAWQCENCSKLFEDFSGTAYKGIEEEKWNPTKRYT